MSGIPYQPTAIDDLLVETLKVVAKAMPVLARYGSRERSPDEEAWSVYSHAVKVMHKAHTLINTVPKP